VADHKLVTGSKSDLFDRLRRCGTRGDATLKPYERAAITLERTPDPYRAGGAASNSVSNPSDPNSWNRYSYTRGDPVNRYDPVGTCDLTTYSTSPNGTITVDCTDFINNFFFGLQQYAGGWGSSTYLALQLRRQYLPP
jgi:hypothetical protein